MAALFTNPVVDSLSLSHQDSQLIGYCIENGFVSLTRIYPPILKSIDGVQYGAPWCRLEDARLALAIEPLPEI